jgi:hypothetical protein
MDRIHIFTTWGDYVGEAQSIEILPEESRFSIEVNGKSGKTHNVVPILLDVDTELVEELSKPGSIGLNVMLIHTAKHEAGVVWFKVCIASRSPFLMKEEETRLCLDAQIIEDHNKALPSAGKEITFITRKELDAATKTIARGSCVDLRDEGDEGS